MKLSTKLTPRKKQPENRVGSDSGAKPLKIALVLDDSLDRNDGVQQYVRSLGGWLSAQGNAVHYLAGESKVVTSEVKSLSRNVGVKFNGNRLTIPLPANNKRIKTLLEQENYDIVHVQLPYSPMMAGKVIRYVPAKTAVIGTFHILPLGRLQQHGSRALASVQRATLGRFDAICSVSAPAQAFAKTHFGLTTTVISNMIDVHTWQNTVRPHPQRIVFLGRLVPRKGCMELLKAISLLCDRLENKNIEVLVGGTGPELQKLKMYCERNGLSQVRFLGFVEEKDKASLLASAEIAIFPSLGGESFGIVLIEAMAAGAGVVLGGNNPGYTSVLSFQPDTIFDPRKTTELSELLSRFLADSKLRRQVHKQQQHAVKLFDTSVVGEQILDLYQTALLHHKRNVR